MRRIDHIVVHCSATRGGKDFKAKDIDRWHKELGWDGIGYHYETVARENTFKYLYISILFSIFGVEKNAFL